MPSDGKDIAGEIRVRLGAHAGAINAVEIVSTRPRDAARIFEGKPVAEMTGAIGRVFSLCGTAQTVAALAAVEAALDCRPDPTVAAARNAARRAEMVTQLVMRLALHWPRVLDLPIAPEAVRAAMAVEREIEAGLLGPDWRAPGSGCRGEGPRAIVAWPEVRALVARLADALRSRGLEAYGRLPDGVAPEAGVLAHYWDAPAVAAARSRHGAGLAARLAAAETALHAASDMFRADLAAVRPAEPRALGRDSGAGEATVETARGPLTHRVEIDAGRVARCRTDAPTEPNFASSGPVSAGLVGAQCDLTAAELHVLAIDPCVACRVELASI